MYRIAIMSVVVIVGSGCSGTGNTVTHDGGIAVDGFWIETDAGADAQGIVLYHSSDAARNWQPWRLLLSAAGTEYVATDCGQYATSSDRVELVDGGGYLGMSLMDGPTLSFGFDAAAQPENLAVIEQNVNYRNNHIGGISVEFDMNGALLDGGLMEADLEVRYLDLDSGALVTSESRTMVFEHQDECPSY